MRPTTFLILDRVLRADRVVFHCDEADKWNLDVTREWSAAMGSDLWNTLDGHFPIADYLRETEFEDVPKPSLQELEGKVRSRLWIVGSGTWQHLFARGSKPAAMGFASSAEDSRVTADDIRRSEMISPELLLRFNSHLIFLSYPTAQETPDLLRASGITALADELGVVLTPDDVNWERGGMRVLETLATRLALEKYRRKRKA